MGLLWKPASNPPQIAEPYRIGLFFLLLGGVHGRHVCHKSYLILVT